MDRTNTIAIKKNVTECAVIPYNYHAYCNFSLFQVLTCISTKDMLLNNAQLSRE